MLRSRDYDYLLSSEKGVVDLKRTITDPRPLAPGEKIAIVSGRGRNAEILDYGSYQQRLLHLLRARQTREHFLHSCFSPSTAAPSAAAGKKAIARLPWHGPAREILPRDAKILGAFGWQKYDLMIREKVAREGREVIGSLGHTGPLAPFVPQALPNVADYFKENVAVVTNPAIDREREAEHFSTHVILGSRPNIDGQGKTLPIGLEIQSPLLLGGRTLPTAAEEEEQRTLAGRFNTLTIDDVLAYFTGGWRDPGRIRLLDATFHLDGGLGPALESLKTEACRAVENGTLLLVLDDSRTFREQRVYIDPALAAASLHEELIRKKMRRKASIVIRSAAIRNLHDIMVLLGLGADAVNPYLLWQVSTDFADDAHKGTEILTNTLTVLQKGMEKVMSTMGIHELCGYGRIFSAIGLGAELAGIFRTPCFCTSNTSGLSLAELERLARLRYARATGEEEVRIFSEAARNPRVGKILRSVAVGKKGYLEMMGELERIEGDLPTGIRHLLDLKKAAPGQQLTMEQVDISIGGHSMPLLIAAMSFGSQGENSFRTYAEAAKRANIICINGEGGEIPDMLGRYRKNRGQQVASGRFGVSMEFLNSADYLEIKIGQGAKPGEGGHLPGNKVTAMVANARHCKPGTTLISPHE